MHGPSSLSVVLDRVVIREDKGVSVRRSKWRFVKETAAATWRSSAMDCNSTMQAFAASDADAPSNRSGRFSFPSITRWAPADCKGFGNVLRYDPALVIPDHSKSLVQGAIEPWSKPGTDWWQKQMLLAMKRKGVDITRPFKLLDEDVKTLLWKGDKTFDGIDDFFQYLEGKRYKLHVRVLLSRYRTPFDCPGCHGSRLKPTARFVKIGGVDIHDVTAMTIEHLMAWLQGWPYGHMSEALLPIFYGSSPRSWAFSSGSVSAT